MSFVRVILLGTYLAGAVGLLLAVVIRMGVALGQFTPRGALGFAGVCFLCTLATREVAAVLEKPKEGETGKAAA